MKNGDGCQKFNEMEENGHFDVGIQKYSKDLHSRGQARIAQRAEQESEESKGGEKVLRQKKGTTNGWREN